MSSSPAPDFSRNLQDAIATTGVTGAASAYWDGERLHTAVAGLRNSVTADRVTPDTLMHIGSITKVFNAVLVMQLVDEGKIALDDPVAKYLPELQLRDRDALARITCGMLLSHSSGIDGMWLPEVGPDEERIVDTIERCAALGQLHDPGEMASYCNVGSVIAGYLVQKLRGTSWYTLMRTHIYEPLGMTHALVEFSDIPRFRCSIGDVTNPKTGKLVQSPRPFLAPSFAPAGSTQMMTATDLMIFARALINGGVGPNGRRILSRAAAELMGRPRAAFASTPSMTKRVGLGWMVLPGGVLSHGGGGPGVYSALYAHPASGRILVLLRNCDRGGAMDPYIVEPLLEQWTGLGKPVPPNRLAGSVDPAPYVGSYQNVMYRIEVACRDGRLTMQLGEARGTRSYAEAVSTNVNSAAPLHPLGDHAFEAEYLLPVLPSTEVKFLRPDENGRMRSLSFYGTALVTRAD